MISILISLVIIGLLLWLVNNYVPMDSKIKSILNVVIVIAVMVWLLQAFGLIGGVGLR
jgi:undecaprenyl pyrophosphate phosphatase UppP